MLKGKTAVVTGASRGIGAAIAEKFSELGANVAIIYNGNEEKANEVLERVQNNGVKAEIYKCNVASMDECKDTVKKITEALGSADVLVNNAGITKDNLLLMMSEEEFDDVVNINLKGCFNMIKACGRGFIKKKYGKIINISSVSGLSGIAGQANYSASKAGLIGLTKTTAKEFASRGIRCNAVAPGFIASAMTDALPDDVKKQYFDAIPLSKFGTGEQIADVVAFLASDMSEYVTGQVINVDGGLVM